METTIIEGLAQYGPLGLWTASLLFMNWQQRHMLQNTMDKIEGGLTMVREKYAEERLARLKDK